MTKKNNNIDSINISSELVTRATAELNEKILEELKIDDPVIIDSTEIEQEEKYGKNRNT